MDDRTSDRPAARRRANIFAFRRLKWGAPKRLEGLKAIGLADTGTSRVAPARRSGGWIGLAVAGAAAGLAIGMSLLGWF